MKQHQFLGNQEGKQLLIFTEKNDFRNLCYLLRIVNRKGNLSQSSASSDSDVESNNATGTASQSKSKGPRARVQPRNVARKSSDSEPENLHGKLPGEYFF